MSQYQYNAQIQQQQQIPKKSTNIMYYSTHCEHSRKLLQEISKTNLRQQMHFICIDKRVRGSHGEILIVLDNGSAIPLPPHVKTVPTLMITDDNARLIEGQQIYDYLFPKQDHDISKQGMNANNGPLPFSVGTMGGFVVSDTYSFLSQSPEELMAKGSGSKQLHHYASINHVDKIETPSDDYTPDKVGEISLEKLREQRERDVPRQTMRM